MKRTARPDLIERAWPVVMRVVRRTLGAADALARERLLRYASAVASLGGGQAEVVYLHDVPGHDLGEIAAALRITTAAAQSRLHRGRRQIAIRLKVE
jgi:DNA-directed RNA polymerase specialized sigma24 family protein